MTNLCRNLIEAAEMYPCSTAVRSDTKQWTYAQLNEASASVSLFLEENGIGTDDRVGVLLGNEPAFLAAYYGVLRSGAIVVPLDPHARADDIAVPIADSTARLVLAARECPIPELPVPVHLVDREILDGSARTGHRPAIARGTTDLAALMYTTAADGQRHGAALTHGNLSTNHAIVARTILHLGPDDLVVSALPVYESFGATCAMNAAIASGAQLRLVSPRNPIASVRVLASEPVTVIQAAPDYLAELAAHYRASPTGSPPIRLGVTVGDRVSEELITAFGSAFDCPLLLGYGGPETSPFVTFTRPDTPLRPGLVGSPIQGVDIQVIDSYGCVLPPGHDGEILVRGPNLMKGYWGRPDITAQHLLRGWFRTGQLGHRDTAGDVILAAEPS